MLPSTKKQNKGFTLAEIITVVIITGVLASLAIPKLTGTIERVRAAEGVQFLTALLGAQKAYFLENNSTYATTTAALDVDITTSSNFEISVNSPDINAADPIVRIRRTNAYWLEIDADGTIGCTNAVPNAFTCAQAGYN